MASTRKLTTKDGRVFYEITVSRGRNKARLTKRWYPPDGWGKRAIERELAAVAAEFERQSDTGEVVSRAEQKEREAEEAREAAKILTLRQYGERVFMPSKTVTMSESGRSAYQGYLNRRIYPVIGDLKITEISPAQITELLLGVQSEGKAHGTVMKIYTILHSLFRMAYRGDVVDRNPMDKVDPPKPRKDEIQKTGVEAFSVAEIRQVIDCLESEPLKWRAYIRLMMDTGVRRGECCAVKWSNVDFQTGAVLIDGNVGYTPEKGVYLDTPKNSRVRTVYVGEETAGLLRQLHETQKKSGCDSVWAFTRDGSADVMNPKCVTAYFKSFSARYGIRNFHPHKLRHTFASLAIANGADVASVAEAMGHSDKAVTLRVYTHSSRESVIRAGEIFRRSINGAGQNQ
ncbi:MAG: site-specific integrase [Clostridia bacterium]|nr:site-specific integrase [Clostridia bacterium]